MKTFHISSAYFLSLTLMTNMILTLTRTWTREVKEEKFCANQNAVELTFSETINENIQATIAFCAVA